MELCKLKFHEREFDESSEMPDNSLNDITKLAIIGMPTHMRLKLLMQPETTT